MDHILRLHVVERHTARHGNGVDASSCAVLALAAVAFLAVVGSQLAMSKAALFVLSNAIILALLAADWRCFFFASAESATTDVVVDACGDVLEKPPAMRRPVSSLPSAREQDQPRRVRGIHRGTTALDDQALEEQEDVTPASRPEQLPGLPDEAESVALELETLPAVEELTCKTAVPGGLDELGIDELNKKFDEFIQSRRNKWINEEAYLQL